MARPNWNAQKVFIPGKVDVNRPYQKYKKVITQFLNKHPIEGRSRKFFVDHFDGINFNRPFMNWAESTPYDQVIQAIQRSRISLPILNPGCIIEAACQGVPSVMWEHGGFFNPLAQQLNLNIEHDAPPERFAEVANLLMTNEKVYRESVMAMQDYFIAHTYQGSLRYFNLMMEMIQS